MATITEDYVSFETAKLLKEKGFDEECFALYNPDGILIQSGIRLNNIQVGRVKGSYSAPTHQMAMKWFRKVHDIDISIIPLRSHKEYLPRIESNIISHDDIPCKEYEEAAEVAIKYCLENLIK